MYIDINIDINIEISYVEQCTGIITTKIFRLA